MGQSDGYGLVLADVGGGGGGMWLPLALADVPGGAIYRVLILGGIHPELDLILQTAVVVLPLDRQGDHIPLRQPGVGQGGLLRSLLTDVGAGGSAAGGGGAPALLLGFHHSPGEGVDVVLILAAIGIELQLIDHPSILIVEVYLQYSGLGGGDAGVREGGSLGGFHADVGAVAGLAGGLDHAAAG